MKALIGLSFRLDGNRVRCDGVSFGYGDSDPYLIRKGVSHVVIRCPSTGEWLELGATTRVPAKWYLLEVEFDGDTFKLLHVVKEKEPGSLWRATKRDLLLEMIELERDVPGGFKG